MSARWLQYGGRSSYSLYLVHMFFVCLFYWLHGTGPLAMNLLAAAACLAGIALATHLLFRYVEEPARHRLRALVPRPAPAGQLPVRPHRARSCAPNPAPGNHRQDARMD